MRINSTAKSLVSRALAIFTKGGLCARSTFFDSQVRYPSSSWSAAILAQPWPRRDLSPTLGLNGAMNPSVLEMNANRLHSSNSINMTALVCRVGSSRVAAFSVRVLKYEKTPIRNMELLLKPTSKEGWRVERLRGPTTTAVEHARETARSRGNRRSHVGGHVGGGRC